jgi:hypothetical protein
VYPASRTTSTAARISQTYMPLLVLQYLNFQNDDSAPTTARVGRYILLRISEYLLLKSRVHKFEQEINGNFAVFGVEIFEFRKNDLRPKTVGVTQSFNPSILKILVQTISAKKCISPLVI